MTYYRYAIYWAPRQGSAFAEFARNWFGCDTETGEPVGTRDTYGLDAVLVERATASPRRYGVHATLKAPFRLADTMSENGLAAEMAAFAARRRRPCAGKLRLQRFSQYLALVPESDTAELDWLAAECVTHFERFRAPLNDADRARRAPDLSGSAAEHFQQFGYPDIFERFMFHITLAGPLDEGALDAVQAALGPAVSPFTETPFVADDLCLSGDPGGSGSFQIVRRASFAR